MVLNWKEILNLNDFIMERELMNIGMERFYNQNLVLSANLIFTIFKF